MIVAPRDAEGTERGAPSRFIAGTPGAPPIPGGGPPTANGGETSG
jgi:hypothetical protein